MNLICVKLRAACFTRGARQQFLQGHQVLVFCNTEAAKEKWESVTRSDLQVNSSRFFFRTQKQAGVAAAVSWNSVEAEAGTHNATASTMRKIYFERLVAGLKAHRQSWKITTI